ncbi:MAG: CAP domain-containing protein [Flavobacteriales bacterium]|nr:hypothetical protein [Flavobacteriales bacterium]MBX2958926.1 CAP domain-containing protein [Flavobacteriales bacterium]
MKKLSLLLGVIAFCINSSTAQTKTVTDLPELLANKFEGQSQAIERAAALEFHKLINQYRSENLLQPLVWDDTIWVAAKNHSLWMRFNTRLSHHETNSMLFTGKTPEDRYYFVTEGKPTVSINGENILLNFSCKGKNVEQTALNIAKESFEQWKSSAGHNENMLSPGFIRHGVAFCVNEDNVWATNMFSYGYQPTNYIYEPMVTRRTKNLNPDYANIQQDVLSSLLEKLKMVLNIKPKQTKKLNGEAYRSAKSIVNVRPATKETQNIILAKQETINTKGLIGFKTEKQVYHLVIEKKANDFNIDMVTNELIDFLKKNQELTHAKKLGMSIAIVKRKDRIRIALVSIAV